MYNLNLEPWRVLCMSKDKEIGEVNGIQFKLGIHPRDKGEPDGVYLTAKKPADYVEQFDYDEYELYDRIHVRYPLSDLVKSRVALMTRVELYQLLLSGEFQIS